MSRKLFRESSAFQNTLVSNLRKGGSGSGCLCCGGGRPSRAQLNEFWLVIRIRIYNNCQDSPKDTSAILNYVFMRSHILSIDYYTTKISINAENC